MKKVLQAMILAACFTLFALPLSNAAAAGTKNQWVLQNHHWSYYNANGSLQKGWLMLGKQWYHFDANGVMQTGWVKAHNKWYFLDSTGAMKTGWLKSGSNWYFLNSGGDMQTGWAKIQGKWYFLDGSGAMKSGWLKSGTSWYYLNQGGDMQTGWLKLGGGWYFFKNDGAWDGKANTQAPQDSINFAVIGTSSVSPGIYSSVPNGNSTAVMKENTYQLVETTTPPFTLDDATNYKVKGGIATKYNQYGNLNNPIESVQTVGNDLYFTKFLFYAEYDGGCGGGNVDVLELYKRDSNGTITKVTSDRMSTHTTKQFFISGSNLYYAKVENSAFSNYTIVKSSLDGKTKTTLAAGVDDFWVNQGSIYYEKDGKLSSMDLNGGNVQTVSNIQTKLYTSGGCSEGDFTVSNNGVTITDYSAHGGGIYFYDFATKTIITLPITSVIDADFSRKLIATQSYDYTTNKETIALYDFNGKLQKTLETDDFSSFNILSLDVKKGELLYVTGSSLKLINF